MMGRLYSFSHKKAKLLRMFFEKEDKSKESLKKQNPQLHKALYHYCLMYVC